MIKYFKGFNGLRFLAAFVVLLSHSYQSILKQHFIFTDSIGHFQLFHRGAAAVNFFFTLSGFLISYLLINEYKSTTTISIKNFYLRRVFRIWPLYFFILLIGIVFFVVIFPMLTQQSFLEGSEILNVILLYIVFLPNLASAIYKVGLLHPLWSIGVEEQFYLIWAPLVKLFKVRIVPAAIILLIFSFLLYLLPSIINTNSAVTKFIQSLRFHYMAIGALFAAFIANKSILELKIHIINSLVLRWVIPLLLVIYYCTQVYFISPFILDLFVSALYGVLLIQVFVNNNAIINLESKVLNYLGSISYGIYMYHLLVDYVFRTISLKLHLHTIFDSSVIFLIIYTIVLLTGTVVVSHFSFKYFEKFFIKIKNKKYSYES